MFLLSCVKQGSFFSFVLVLFSLLLSCLLFFLIVLCLGFILHCVYLFCCFVLFLFSAFGLYDIVSSFFFSLVFIVSGLSLAVYLSLLINFTIPISPACLVEVPIAVNQNPQFTMPIAVVLGSQPCFIFPPSSRNKTISGMICSYLFICSAQLGTCSTYIDFDSIRWRFHHRKCLKKNRINMHHVRKAPNLDTPNSVV